MHQPTVSQRAANVLSSGGTGRRVALCAALALLLAWIKTSFLLPSESMAGLWEQTSIYLNAYHLTLGRYLLYPDAGYVNMLPKLAAFLVLRFFGLVAIYPLAFTFASLFLAALGLLLFTSKRFEAITPSPAARLAFCLFLFFFPGGDFFAPYNASYFLVFFLVYCLFALLGQEPLDKKTFLFVILSAPVAVLAKPLFFLFGPVFLLLLALRLRRAARGAPADGRAIAALAWIVLLYGFQFFHTLHFYPDLGQPVAAPFAAHGGPAARAFFLAGRFVTFLGYGVAAPLNVALSARFGSILFPLVGLGVLAALAANVRAHLRGRYTALLVLSGTLLACCLFSIFGIFKNGWLYQCTFSDYLFTRPWDHRHLFSFVVFSNVQLLVLATRAAREGSAPRRRAASLAPAAYCVLAAVSLCLLDPFFFGPFHRYSLTWPEARTLLSEEQVFIPIPQLAPEWLPRQEFATPSGLSGKYVSRLWGLMYSPTCTWASGVVDAARIADADGMATYRHAFAVRDRAVKYVMLFPERADGVILPEGSFLTVRLGGRAVRGRLVNPGARGFYLFDLESPVASQDTAEFAITSPGGYLPRAAFSVLLVGLW